MLQAYRIVIENERYKYVRIFQVFILLVNAASLFYAAYHENDFFAWFWPSLLMISIIFIMYEKRLRKYLFFQKTNFTATGFIWAVMGWLSLSYWIIAALVALIGVLQFIVKKKFEVVFFKNEIHVPLFDKKIFSWFELENVILKDGLLTIDFKNNKLLQSEILAIESNIKNEAEFNEFCKFQLTTIYN